jgi:serine/threonine-protein kinase
MVGFAPEGLVDLTENTVIAERFRLIRPLGQGGMGSVWLAHHITLDVECALKFILAEAAAVDEVRGRFEREARAAAKLRSPHIVQVLDHGEWEGAPYIAMELLLGEDLATRLERKIRLTPKETVEIVAQVARALTRAHAADLVHRDLKPANLFLVPDDDREIVKVLDFGIAKSTSPLDAGLTTKTGALLGTPAYMSPEQAQGTKKVDHRTDLWSLAVIAFECLTGQRPFDSPALGDLLMQIMTNPLPVPSQVAPVPRGFDAFWLRAAARDPEARFQSARELAEALAEALDCPVDEARRIGSRASFADAMTADLPRPSLTTLGASPTLAAAPLEIAAAPARPPRRRALAMPIAVAALILLGSAAIATMAWRGRAPEATATAPLDASSPRAPAASAPSLAAIPPLQGAAVEPSITTQPIPSVEAAASASPVASARPLVRAKPPRPTSSPTSRPRYDDGI